MGRISLVNLFVILFFIPHVFAARPLSTDDAGTIDRRTFEIEAGCDITEDPDYHNCYSTTLSLKHGLTEKLDFCIAIPYEIKPQKGLGNASIGVKFALFKKNTSAISFTFSSESGGTGYTLNGILTKEIGQLTSHLNLGYVASGKMDEKDTTTYSGAIEFPFSKRLVIVGEIIGTADIDSTHKNPLEGLFGANFQVFENLIFDFGIGITFNNVGPNWKITVGITHGL